VPVDIGSGFGVGVAAGVGEGVGVTVGEGIVAAFESCWANKFVSANSERQSNRKEIRSRRIAGSAPFELIIFIKRQLHYVFI